MDIEEIIKTEEKSQDQSNDLEVRFTKERLEWTKKIEGMSKKLRNLQELNDLLTEIHTERQRAVEYYHYLEHIFSKITMKYRKQWAERYDYYSYQSQKRFPNEKTKEIQILSDLNDIVLKREMLSNHLKFMDSSIKTVDNITYGINHKIKIEELSKGK
jgi:hypothetical protein